MNKRIIKTKNDFYVKERGSKMKSVLSRKDFYELRNQLYGRLVIEKELKDTDNNFILIEDIICETINIDWES